MSRRGAATSVAALALVLAGCGDGDPATQSDPASSTQGADAEDPGEADAAGADGHASSGTDAAVLTLDGGLESAEAELRASADRLQDAIDEGRAEQYATVTIEPCDVGSPDALPTLEHVLLLEGADLEQLVPRAEAALEREVAGGQTERIDPGGSEGPDVVLAGDHADPNGGGVAIALAAGDGFVAVTLQLLGPCVAAGDWAQPAEDASVQGAGIELEAGLTALLAPLDGVQAETSEEFDTCTSGVRRAALDARVTDPQQRARGEVLDLIQTRIEDQGFGDQIARTDDRRLEVADASGNVYTVRAVDGGVIVWATSPCQPEG